METRQKVANRRENRIHWLSQHVRTHCVDPTHAHHVTDLALFIFNELSALHGYSDRERRILETASMLHDIGISVEDDEEHHKISRKKILALEIPDLDSEDRFLAAQIARYHRKSEPNADKHKTFGTLDHEKQQCVRWLSGILRVADGLDRTHLGLVNHPSIELTDEECVISIDSPQALYEVDGALRKGGLLQEMIQRRLKICIVEDETV